MTKPIPSTGEPLPVIGIGTWQSFDVRDDETARAPLRDVLRAAAESGARVVDSSPMYGAAEAVLGELAEGLGLRDKLFYATKVWTRGRAEGVRQMEHSFRRMRVARMDLMQARTIIGLPRYQYALSASVIAQAVQRAL